MQQKLPVDGFKWWKDLFKFDEEQIQEYDEDSHKGYILEVDVKYPKGLHKLHSYFMLLPKRMKIDKCEKLMFNLYDMKIYDIDIRVLKETLDHEIILEKVHKVIKFNKEAWLRPYIETNAALRTKAKNGFEKDVFRPNGLFSVQKDYGKWKEAQRYHTCGN